MAIFGAAVAILAVAGRVATARSGRCAGRERPLQQPAVWIWSARWVGRERFLPHSAHTASLARGNQGCEQIGRAVFSTEAVLTKVCAGAEHARRFCVAMRPSRASSCVVLCHGARIVWATIHARAPTPISSAAPAQNPVLHTPRSAAPLPQKGVRVDKRARASHRTRGCRLNQEVEALLDESATPGRAWSTRQYRAVIAWISSQRQHNKTGQRERAATGGSHTLTFKQTCSATHFFAVARFSPNGVSSYLLHANQTHAPARATTSSNTLATTRSATMTSFTAGASSRRRSGRANRVRPWVVQVVAVQRGRRGESRNHPRGRPSLPTLPAGDACVAAPPAQRLPPQ